jgi:iron complex outermembrane receptor protein
VLRGPRAGEPTQSSITGSLARARVFEAPYAIGSVDRDTLRVAGPLVNLSEALVRVPGLVVNNRSNYAQDLQISSRGFGARAGFGVRGIRLYADGIPASGPDGQGQVSHFDLAGAERVEVLRGPFSVLYGNSSGGVISLSARRCGATRPTAPPTSAASACARCASAARRCCTAAFAAGRRLALRDRRGAGAQRGAARPGHAAPGLAGRRRPRHRAAGQPPRPAGAGPAGPVAGAVRRRPRQTTPAGLQFDTRKTVRQTQLGASWRHRFADGVLRETQLAAYGGRRAVTQFLAIAPATQANPATAAAWSTSTATSTAPSGARGWPVGRSTCSWVRRWTCSATTAAATRTSPARRLRRRCWAWSARCAATRPTRRARADVFAQAEWTPQAALALTAGVRSGRCACGR